MSQRVEQPEQPEQLGRLELDIDLRLGSLWAKLLDESLPEAELQIAAVFMRAAYAYGYCDGQKELPGLLDEECPAFDLRLASLWPELMAKGLEVDSYRLVATYCREACAEGYRKGQAEPIGQLERDNGYPMPPVVKRRIES